MEKIASIVLLTTLSISQANAVVEVTKCCPVHSVLVETEPERWQCRPREELSIDEAAKIKWEPTFYEYKGNWDNGANH